MSDQRKIFQYRSLKEVATRLRDDLNNRDYVLLFAYNGTGKTRLSMTFKDKSKKRTKNPKTDTLYYNAYTEDLFHWNNDLENDSERHLTLNKDSVFFDGFKELALEEKIFAFLERYADFDFKIDYDKWIISFHKGDQSDIKISRGEENIFIWCVFLAIVQLTIEDEEKTGPYNWVEYLYIDDPVSSLDDNNAIGIASDLAKLLKQAKGKLKSIISSHHALFYNVMFNELKKEGHKSHFLHKNKGTGYLLQTTDDTPFFHHVALLAELKAASENDKIKTYHFNMLRGILEKTSTFFGFDEFSHCIYGVDDEVLYSRALNLLSHSKYSIYQPVEMNQDNKDLFKRIFKAFLHEHQFQLPEIFSQEEISAG
ncbi:MAG: AAA family ATPase [Xanthomonadales bacterium]|nr:AAA family ATPase [Xanthomonadales bacterium]